MLKKITAYTNMVNKNKIANMFSQISQSYDFLNHFLSFNIDKYWRRKTAKELSFNGKILLDVCSGTGDMALSFKNNSIKIISDFCHPLLLKAKKKCINKSNVMIVEADALNLPFKSDSIDAITIAFGIRNIENFEEALKEFYRVLKNNGKLAILEFSLPKNKYINFIYSLYLKYYVPLMGKLISGNHYAYSYLYQSIQEFPRYEALTSILNKHNFVNTHYYPLTFGIATIYIGSKIN
jgi:demethylmenaquinone methyltransferase/2-methoxy-6-polyprenyl-1,4-benzoquinol methylase